VWCFVALGVLPVAVFGACGGDKPVTLDERLANLARVCKSPGLACDALVDALGHDCAAADLARIRAAYERADPGPARALRQVLADCKDPQAATAFLADLRNVLDTGGEAGTLPALIEQLSPGLLAKTRDALVAEGDAARKAERFKVAATQYEGARTLALNALDGAGLAAIDGRLADLKAAEGPAETRRLLLAAASELAEGRIVSGYGLASRVKAAPCIAAPLAEALARLKDVKLAEDEHYAYGEKLQKAMGHMGQARALWQEAQRQGHDEAARLAKAEYDKGKAEYDAGRGALVPRVRRLNALRERLPGVRRTLESLAEKKC